MRKEKSGDPAAGGPLGKITAGKPQPLPILGEAAGYSERLGEIRSEGRRCRGISPFVARESIVPDWYGACTFQLGGSKP